MTIERTGGMVRWTDERGELLFWGTEEAWHRLEAAARRDLKVFSGRLDNEALRQATTRPREPGMLPHHLRCDSIVSGRRCILDCQHIGEHKFA